MYTLMPSRTGFRYYALFKWNGLQTALKLDSYITHGDFKAVLSNVSFMSLVTDFINSLVIV